MNYDVNRQRACVNACARQSAGGAVKITEDLYRYAQIVAEYQIRTVLECGTFSGKSALWFARLPSVDRVVTVDVNPIVDRETSLGWRHDGVIGFRGSSVAPDIVRAMRGLCEGYGPVLLVLDSDHSRPHVLRELDAYADIATYIVVEDGVLHWLDARERSFYDGDPLQAITEWLPSHPEWSRDVDTEDRFDVTMHVNGWLRRL